MYCTMSAFGGDALQRKAMSHKSSFIILDTQKIVPEAVSHATIEIVFHFFFVFVLSLESRVPVLVSHKLR